MIESFSDYIATGVLMAFVVVALFVVARLFLAHRQRRLMEEEIEYYQDW